jgi:DNA-binding HxlR family transcriptional regulator
MNHPERRPNDRPPDLGSTAPAWDVARLVACERSSPPSSDDAPPRRYPHLVVDDTWDDDEIAAITAIHRRAWLRHVEATRITVDAERDEQRRARAKPLPRGLSPIEHGRIMREASRWKRFDNGRPSEASHAPLLSSSGREVLAHLVEYVNWLTRERDTTIEALRRRAGYRNERTIRRALRELEALGLFVRIEQDHRVLVRLTFSNVEELRALMMRAAARRAMAVKAENAR